MRFRINRVLLQCVCISALAGQTGLQAQFIPASEYHQSEAVKRRYGDPKMKFDTPGFASGKSDFTGHEEMMEFIYALQAKANNMSSRIIGYSQEGRAIAAMIFSNSGTFSTAELLRLNRPVVFLQGLQHGNEPAGGEAMLLLAKELASGALRPLLDRITVVIVPRCNPDGASYFTRDTPRRVDINRDHIKMDLPETEALHRLLNEFQPEVVVDAHEFSVATRWLEKFGMLQSWDLMMLYATTANLPPALTQLAEGLFRRNMVADVERAGYSQFWYYTTSYNEADKRVSMGGTAPDIGRNAGGLQNAISFLIESRGVGIGREGFARRVHSHYVAIGALLQTSADHASEVMRAVSASRAEVARRGREIGPGNEIVVTARGRITKQKLTMIDPVSGELKDLEVDWEDTLATQAQLTRQRPYAYLLAPSFNDIARRLALSGIEVKKLRVAADLEVESFQVLDRRGGATFVEGYVRQSVSTEVVKKRVKFPAGTFVFTMAQSNANLLVAALEPESTSSFVSLGLLPVDKKGTHPSIGASSEVPVYRLLQPQSLDFLPVVLP
ncbi:MAG: peptidase M14 [Deltaproteobacteria bacterium]|nr:peptidase M14 [Deltaproteobacteria bacterium]